MERSHSSSSDDDKRSLRHRGRSSHGRLSRKRLARVIDDNPSLVLDLGGARPPCCGIPGSHWVLYIGFGASVLIWGAALVLGVLGGATGGTRVTLAQPNCTEGLGASLSSSSFVGRARRVRADAAPSRRLGRDAHPLRRTSPFLPWLFRRTL